LTDSCAQVQDVLFQLPLHPFIKGSTSFGVKHGLIYENREPVARDREMPVVVDAEPLEFEAFVRVLLSKYVFLTCDCLLWTDI
jgi:hypothetical protein